MYQRIGSVLLWVIPAMVFFYSGLSKFLEGPAQQPEILAQLLSEESYAWLLAVLGGVEIAVGIALTWRRSRPYATAVGLLLLTFFSAVIAASATDESFLNNCGCGAWIGSWEFMQNATAMLARNGVLAFFLAVCARPGLRLRNVFGVAAMIFACLLVAEKWRSQEDRAVLNTLMNENRTQRTGWIFPSIRLRSRSGEIVTADSVLRPKDGIMVFSTGCVHCREAAAGWPALRDKLRARGGRFIAVEAQSTAEGIDEFLEGCGLGDVEYFSLLGVRDVLSLGVQSVPHYLELGDRRIVVRQTNGFVSTPAHLALGGIIGTGKLISAVGTRMFGRDRFELRGESKVRGGVTLGRGAVDGEEVVVAIGQNRPSDSFRVECGLALDRQGKIRAVEAIVWKVGLTGMEEPQAYLDKLKGLTLEETVAYCGKLVSVDHNGHVWLALEGVMAHVSNNVAGYW